MKTAEQINAGKNAIVKRMTTEEMNTHQFAILMGMQNAMNWMLDLPGGTATDAAVDPSNSIKDEITEASISAQIKALQQFCREVNDD